MSSGNGRQSVNLPAVVAARPRSYRVDTESRPNADGSPMTSPLLGSTVVDMDIARTLSSPALVHRIPLPFSGSTYLSGDFR
jgi:hypothetical protein